MVGDGVVAEVAPSVRALLHGREADDGLACSRWIVNVLKNDFCVA